MIHIAFGLLEKLYSKLIQIFESTIRVAQSFTRRGRLSPTLGELIKTSDPYHKLHGYINEDV
jgi:hypothetical protein